jgi:hypothetical protein
VFSVFRLSAIGEIIRLPRTDGHGHGNGEFILAMHPKDDEYFIKKQRR